MSEEHNVRLLQIWKAQVSPPKLAPLPFGPPRTGSLVFVGFNPSFTERLVEQFARTLGFDETFFEWSQASTNERYIEIAIDIQEDIRQKYKYFKWFRDVSNRFGLMWDHVDVFPMRGTNQNELKKSVLQKDTELTPLGAECFSLFATVLEATRPRAIVVCNALASNLIRHHWKHRIVFSDEHGWHWLIFAGGRRVPMFFSSMLSGRRPLDIGSRERLEWHVKKAVAIGDIADKQKR